MLEFALIKLFTVIFEIRLDSTLLVQSIILFNPTIFVKSLSGIVETTFIVDDKLLLIDSKDCTTDSLDTVELIFDCIDMLDSTFDETFILDDINSTLFRFADIDDVAFIVLLNPLTNVKLESGIAEATCIVDMIFWRLDKTPVTCEVEFTVDMRLDIKLTEEFGIEDVALIILYIPIKEFIVDVTFDDVDIVEFTNDWTFMTESGMLDCTTNVADTCEFIKTTTAGIEDWT